MNWPGLKLNDVFADGGGLGRRGASGPLLWGGGVGRDGGGVGRQRAFALGAGCLSSNRTRCWKAVGFGGLVDSKEEVLGAICS